MKKNYTEIINNILFEADIECIAEYTEDPNEYLSEAKDIANQITDNMNVEELALVMKNVFNECFLANNYTTEEFTEIATQILKEI